MGPNTGPSQQLCDPGHGLLQGPCALAQGPTLRLAHSWLMLCSLSWNSSFLDKGPSFLFHVGPTNYVADQDILCQNEFLSFSEPLFPCLQKGLLWGCSKPLKVSG